MNLLVALAAAAVLSAPLSLPIDADTLADEMEIVGEQFDTGTVVLGADRLNRVTCEVGEATGEAVIDARLCRFSIDCINANPGNAARIDACIAGKRERLVEILARRNISFARRDAADR